MLDVGLGAVSGLLLSVGVDLEHPRDLTFSTRRMSVIDTDASLRAIERSNLGCLGLQRSRKRAASRARFRVREQVGVSSYDNGKLTRGACDNTAVIQQLRRGHGPHG